jgi:hypothetical protein
MVSQKTGLLANGAELISESVAETHDSKLPTQN